MTKILIATEKPFAPVAVKGIKEVFDKAGFETVLLEKYTEKSQLLETVKDVDGIIVRSDKIDNEVFEAAKNLKIVVRAGAGYDNVDTAAATAHNVCVMNTPGQNSNAVAELAIGMMIYMARGFFSGKSGSELKGKKLGIHGLGNIGKIVAHIAAGFGMDVYAFAPSKTDEYIQEAGAKPVRDMKEFYSLCDYVSINIPARKENLNLINYDLFMAMPKNATFINTARKEVICEEGLKKALAERSDLKYATDIQPVCHEELAKDFAGQYFATPKKMGAQTGEANINAGLAAAKQIVGYIKEGNEQFRVNK